MRTIALAAVFGLVLTGCGSAGTSAPPSSTTTTTVTTTVTVSPSPVSATASTGEVVLTLDRPTNGTSAGGQLAVSGTAAAFEANVPWRITNAQDHVVKRGAFTAQECCQLSPFAGTIPMTGLAAGTYTLTVTLDDPSGGEGKAVPEISVSFTVK